MNISTQEDKNTETQHPSAPYARRPNSLIFYRLARIGSFRSGAKRQALRPRPEASSSTRVFQKTPKIPRAQEWEFQGNGLGTRPCLATTHSRANRDLWGSFVIRAKIAGLGWQLSPTARRDQGRVRDRRSLLAGGLSCYGRVKCKGFTPITAIGVTRALAQVA